MKAKSHISTTPSNFEEIVESLEDMIYELDYSGCFKYGNSSLIKHSGFEKSELRSTKYWEIVKEEHRTKLIEFYKNQRDKKIANTYYEFIMIRKNGDEVWVGQNVKMEFNEEIVTSIRAVARDITRLKTAEEKLKVNEQRLEQLLHHIQLFNEITNATDLIFDDQVNKALSILSNFIKFPLVTLTKIGENKNEITHYHFDGIEIPADQLDLLAQVIHTEALDDVLAFEKIGSNEFPNKHSFSFFEMNSFLGLPIIVNQTLYGALSLTSPQQKNESFNEKEIDFLKTVANWLGMFIERHHYELEFQKQSHLLSQAQNMAQIGQWEFNITQNTLIWSDITKKIHEVPEDFMPDVETAIHFYDEDSQPIITELVSNAIKSGQGWDIKLGIISAKGTHKWIRTIGAVEWSSGKVAKIYGVFQDFSKEKNQEQELLKAKEKAERASQSKADFLSIMSHEIRTPLNAVIGLSHILLEEKPQEYQLDNLKTLRFSAENLLSLINDILDYNKIEAGKVALEQTDFNLREILKSIRQSLVLRAPKNQLNIETRIDYKIPDLIVGDPVRLGQVLNNLTSNALKFTHQGSIIISAHVAEMDNRSLKIDFYVKDTGIGINKNKLDTIFEHFSQAEKETTRKYGGTGLGLAITKKLVNLWGSEIKVESEIDKGSTFSFTLEFKKSTKDITEEAYASKTISHNSLKGTKILLVEDNLVNQMVASKFLDMWGANTDIAEHGFQAIEKVKSNNYDLILMDLQMPEMDGYTAAKEIRKLGGSLDFVPIIALTASALMDIKNNVLASGMNDFVSKPFNPKDLYEKIINNLSIKQNTTPVKTEKSKPFINMAKLESLADKNIPLMVKLLDTFLMEMAKFRDSYVVSIKEGDIAKLQAARHKILPTLKMLEIQLLQKQIDKGEELLASPSSDGKAERINMIKVKHLCNTILDICQNKLNSLD